MQHNYTQKCRRHAVTGLLCGLLSLPIAHNTYAQVNRETTQELSKKAQKGMLIDRVLQPDGSLKFVYKMKVDKKSDEIVYEEYLFDAGLNFKGVQPVRESKQTQPDKKVTSIAAFVGGSNSFNVLSMKLNLQKEEWEKLWDYDKQQYRWGKRLSKDVVKPRNSESAYRGYASYPNDEDGSDLIIATYDLGKKEADDQFVVLYVDNTLSLKETPVPVKGNYSLVFCGKRNSGNVFMILAPDRGMPDTRKYVYAEFTPTGDLVQNSDFTAPSSDLLVMDYQEVDGMLYFCGASTGKDEPYNRVFASYAPIGNPGYSTSLNAQMDKYEKRAYKADFENFHLLKLENGRITMATSTPVKQFKGLVKTPPSQRKGKAYKGNKLVIEDFTVTPEGEYLVAGQLQEKKIINHGKDYAYYYNDIICLHFKKDGQLKAQYSVKKAYDDKKSIRFQTMQRFFFSKDGRTAYWELLDAKGEKGYASFMDAFNGDATLMPHYFPRMARIDLGGAAVSDFTVMGDKGKYRLYKYSYLWEPATRTRYYVGHDEDYKKLWVAKYVCE